MSLTVWIAVLVGGGGALLIIFEGKIVRLLNFEIGYGEALFFVGCVCHALYAALIPKLNKGESAISQTFGTLLAASVILSMLSAKKIVQTDWISLSAMVWFSLIYLAVFATAASFFLIQFSSRRLSSLKVMAYTYAVPFWVTSLEFSLARAELSIHLIFGGLIIFAALLFLLLNKELRCLKILKKTIVESCKIKKNIVQKDEKENNLRKVLNLGHTFAHAYEASLNYSKKLNHGEAVILGIYSALKFSLENKLLNISDFNLILKHLQKSKLNFNIKKYFSKVDIKKIISYMQKDKKNNSSKINLILLKKIGVVDLKKIFSHKQIYFFLDKFLMN